MNEIQISGTIFSPREFGKKKMFRLAFYNGKTPSGDYKKDGYIDCKITSVTKINNVEIKELERVELQGYLTCDYWEYQGKKYSQLTIVVTTLAGCYDGIGSVGEYYFDLGDYLLMIGLVK